MTQRVNESKLQTKSASMLNAHQAKQRATIVIFCSDECTHYCDYNEIAMPSRMHLCLVSACCDAHCSILCASASASATSSFIQCDDRFAIFFFLTYSPCSTGIFCVPASVVWIWSVNVYECVLNANMQQTSKTTSKTKKWHFFMVIVSCTRD